MYSWVRVPCHAVEWRRWQGECQRTVLELVDRLATKRGKKGGCQRQIVEGPVKELAADPCATPAPPGPLNLDQIVVAERIGDLLLEE